MKIFITGASGFIGKRLCQLILERADHTAVRHNIDTSKFRIQPDTDWLPTLNNIDVLIHLAARVHFTNDKSKKPMDAYREINTENTLNLARQAAQSGIKRFIFISSIKVNGEGKSTAYTEQDTPLPQDAYAMSKYEAEQGLCKIAKQSSMEVVILRPPLVYGPGVKANFLQLLQSVDKGIPLPLGSINNQRSLIYLDNLVDAIYQCISHPNAANQIFLVSDDEAPSTPELIEKIAMHFRKKSRLINLPSKILKALLTLIGKRYEAERLIGSLQVENGKIRQQLSWEPPYQLDDGLAVTIAAYQQSKRNA